jgi:methyl-accepting chemotaxis protein
MNWFLNLATRNKPFLGFGLLALLLATIIGTAYTTIKAVRASQHNLYETAQIAASSHQQLVGMDQVALAMDNIKQASTQNVAGTKQTETAAHSLHEVGQKLKQTVERYKV